MTDNKFSWVETHQQIAAFLIDKENAQQDLIKLLQSIDISPFNDKANQGGHDIELDEIDPFTFFCYLYKYGADRRLKNLQKLAEKLNLPIPSGEAGIPSAQAQKVWLFPYKYKRNKNEIQRLWYFFEKVMNDNVTDADFADILSIRNVARTKLTEALFYIKPEKYLPINGPTKPYLDKILGINPRFDSYTDYLQLLERIKAKINIPFFELSYNAWEWKKQQPNTNYWIFQGNPDFFDIETALRDDIITDWTVTKYKNKIKIGDKVIIWVTGNKAGCYALAEVTTEPRLTDSEDDYLWKKEKKDTLKAGIKITHNLLNKPIFKNDIKDIAELAELKAGRQGTNLEATQEEFETILELAENQNTTQYWLYAPGKNAAKWDEFYELGIMGLGWEDLGDLNDYHSKEELVTKLQALENTDKNKMNDAMANDDFKNKIAIGDVIIVKKGKGELLGYGVVTSDYYYDNERPDYKKCRKVDWKKKGNWKTDHPLALKTLTNITSYPTEHPDYNNYYERLMATMNESIDNRELFTKWLMAKYEKSTGTVNSYIKAIDILSEILSEEIFKISKDEPLAVLYQDLLKEQKNVTGKYYRADAPSYGSNGFYSAAISSYRTFLQTLGNAADENFVPVNYPLNTIFYGPPGTGKTYTTIQRAAEIVANRKIDSYSEALEIFNDKLHNQIEFITFHQNYSYEDFIQGLRPDTENNGQLMFERKDGIFKIMADKALGNILSKNTTKKDFEEVFNTFIKPLVEGEIEEIEVKMKKVSYFITTVSNKSIDFRKASGGTAHALNIDTLKKMYISESLLEIQGLGAYYEPLLNILLSLGKDKIIKKEKPQNYVIIIDEINRANISRVFGELITLIEPDKRSHGSIPLQVKLPSGDKFIVPSNLYIIGTMNTADKSIALLDIALRRRFEFEALYPLYEIEGQEIHDVDILQKINKQIIQLKGHDFQIGHAYFMGSDNQDLVGRINKKVIPLLLEYFMNDRKEVINILSNAGLKVDTDAFPIKITDRNA